MNVAGVAWATVISQYLAVYLIINCLYHTDKAIRSFPADPDRSEKSQGYYPDWGSRRFQGMLFSISNVLIQSAVNSFGSTLVAASSASGNIESFAGTTMNAYYQAAVTFTGQSMGARKYDRIDAIAKVCTGLVFAT